MQHSEDGIIWKRYISDRLSISKEVISKVSCTREEEVSYIHQKTKVYTTKHGESQLKAMLDFCHSEEVSNIDSNSRKIIDINWENHVGILWWAPIVKDQYYLFNQSEEIDKFKTIIPGFITPSFILFFQRWCKCVSNPVMQLCVDIRTISLLHYICALAKYIQVNPSVREAFHNCDCSYHQLPIKDHW